MNIKFDLKKFLYVGEKLGDVKPKLCHNLPRHWAILYCLAQVDRDVVRAAAKAGTIHRGTTLKEAEQVLGVSRYGPAGPREDDDPAMYILEDLTHELHELGLLIEGPDYPPDGYCFVREVEPHDWMLHLNLAEGDKGVEAR